MMKKQGFDTNADDIGICFEDEVYGSSALNAGHFDKLISFSEHERMIFNKFGWLGEQRTFQYNVGVDIE